ncbi:MAG: NUDIX hydrolase [Holophagales bacterium]|jgi:8-oxo-dGTP pyrophosphatase MutT (NUDIX family)|nr:NUDIX hydrolase [Holophagales bacterium]
MRLIAQVYPNFDPDVQWRDDHSKVVAKTPIFSLLEIQRTSPHSSAKGAFYRLICPEWVHVIPFTALDAGLELLAVEQYRHGTDRASLEVPGGVCDHGENPLDAAKRELLEETGYTSNNWISLGSCAPNPAIQNNWCHFFLALDCVPTQELVLDPTEELRVWAMSYSEWKVKLEAGEIHHSLVLAAFERLRISGAWTSLQQQINSMPN